MLSVGAAAPDFELRSHTGRSVRLSTLRGQPVVVAFHPLAFTPVCAVQMQTYEREQPALQALGAHVLSISVDAGPAKKAWAEALGGISYDLLSDFHPKGQVASAYGVLRDDGIAERAVFVVDGPEPLPGRSSTEIPEQPDVAELLAQLRAL